MDRLHQENDQALGSKQVTETLLSVPGPQVEFYKKYGSKGTALIFNHKNFDPSTNQRTRYGTEKDGTDLYNLLSDLNFNVHLYKDLRFSEIQHKLKESASEDHSDSDCLFIAVMTHGDNGILFARDMEYSLRKLWTHFSPLHCPTLAGKPKLFFIQACRGDKTDPGVAVKCDEVDSSVESERVYSIPVMADFLFMYATVEGYYAWRDENTGSPFIQALINQIKIHHKSKDLLTILTHVNREVAFGFRSKHMSAKFDGKKEMCSIVSMLLRLFYID